MTAITCVDDLQRLARRRVPRLFYDYVDSGSWTETTYRANAADLDRIAFRQRVLVNIEQRSLATTMLGREVSMPVALAPTGFAGMQHADGEILAARAAGAAGVPFTLSTMSVCSIEDVAAHSVAPFWFQLYVMRDREFVRALIERAKAARCGALVLTLDLQIPGQRHKDIKNGLASPGNLPFRTRLDMLGKVRWWSTMLGTRRRGLGNIVGYAPGVADLPSASAWVKRSFDPTLTWKDVEWIKACWGGPLILKGILDPEDARAACNSGADALVVSNHGGRQLDGAPSSIAALPGIVDAVGDRIEVHMDGGIRSGQDVARALALGAKGAHIGRAFLYGLGAAGEAGVRQCLEIIRRELDVTLALCGVTDVAQVDRSLLARSATTMNRKIA
ncbi:MAG: alpha-hydroxy-acid oxidizing protein [Sphingopyxis sp.]|nr:alpha-hydroxy-acid oxidizing protein [Sphingopyxis sp.]